ncbi:MAG: hypothetical protein V8Q84_09915 [Bilophila sp.]
MCCVSLVSDLPRKVKQRERERERERERLIEWLPWLFRRGFPPRGKAKGLTGRLCSRVWRRRRQRVLWRQERKPSARHAFPRNGHLPGKACLKTNALPPLALCRLAHGGWCRPVCVEGNLPYVLCGRKASKYKRRSGSYGVDARMGLNREGHPCARIRNIACSSRKANVKPFQCARSMARAFITFGCLHTI